MLLTAFFISSGSASAREIYVDNLRGNDAFLGHTQLAVDENGPVRTIQRALELAQRCDRIILANNPSDPYRESLLLSGERHSGIQGYPFRIEGNGAVIDGSAEIPPEYWHSVGQKGIFVYRPQYLEFQNLFFRGKPIKRLDVTGVKTFTELLQLDWKPMRWCLFNGHVYFQPKDAFMVRADERFLPYDDSVAAKKRAYALTGPKLRHGISLFHVHNIEIQDLTIQGFQNDGIVASDSATSVSLKNVTCRGNARAGIDVGPASSLWLKDCVLGNNQFAQLLTEETSLTSIFTSELISYPAPAWLDQGGTVYCDKKQIEGGLNEPVDPGNEDDENYFGGPQEEEVELKEETIGDDDDDDSETEEAGDDDSETAGDDDDGSSLFGDDSDSDSDSEEKKSGDSEDESSDDSEDGGFSFGGDDDDDDAEDEEGDDDSSAGDSGDSDADASDSEDGGFDFGGDDDDDDDDDDSGITF